ncbi:MAG: multicopper oxidase family protein [Betaproteobacteria bacterium]
MDRRQFLGAAGSAAWLAACGGGGGSDSPMGPMHSGSPSTGTSNPPLGTTPSLSEGQPLRALSRLVNTSAVAGTFEAALTAAPTQIETAPGRRTTFWAYNGAVPGPVIEARAGDRVRIAFTNGLPAQESTIHWHGMPVPASEDGNPLDPVAPGATRVYEFTLPADSAASYWYHPHPHRVTHEQVFRGLTGAFLVRPAVDPLPAGIVDTPLVFNDLRLDANYQIAPNIGMDYMFGREGDVLLVNGGRRPVLTTAPGATHRLRLFNATNARYLRLAFDALTMTLIGSDGGLLAAPLAGVSEVLLAPGERAEVVVAFTTGSVLRALPYDRGSMMMGVGGMVRAAEALLTVRAQGAAVAPVALPSSLRPLAALPAATASQRFVLGPAGMMGGMTGMTMGAFTINGRSFDPNRIDATSRVGAVELWEVVNPTGMDHPFHVHGTQFQVVERVSGGTTIPAPWLAWKDTVNVARGETVRLKVRQSLPGLRMYHCHLLEHEDQGMMGTLSVS